MSTLAIGSLTYGMAGTYGQIREFTEKEKVSYSTHINRATSSHTRGKAILNRRGLHYQPEIHLSYDEGYHSVFLYNLSYQELCEKCSVSNVNPPRIGDDRKEIFKLSSVSGGVNSTAVNKIGINSTTTPITGTEIITLFSTWFVTSRKYVFSLDHLPQSELFFKPNITEVRAHDYLVAFKVLGDWWGLFLVTSNPQIQGRYVNEIADPDLISISYSSTPTRGFLTNGYGLLATRSVGGLLEQSSQSLNSYGVNEAAINHDSKTDFIQPFSDSSGNLRMMTRDGSFRNFTITA